MAIAAGSYLVLHKLLGKEPASWICLLLAAPVAVAGFFSYNGLTFEQFVLTFIKTEFLCAGPRRFISRNHHYEALGRKENNDFD